MDSLTMTNAMPPAQAGVAPSFASTVTGGSAWDEAFLRVESYLRAHHVESRVLLNHLATDIIREAHERTRANPGNAPVTIAMQVTHERIGAWFSRLGSTGDWSDKRMRAAGRLALVLADLPGSWANCFLSSGPIPPEFLTALTSGVLRPGPELRFSNMSAVPLEFSLNDPDNPNCPKQGMWSGMRAAAGWLAIVGLYGAAWAASH